MRRLGLFGSASGDSPPIVESEVRLHTHLRQLYKAAVDKDQQESSEAHA